MENKIAIIYGTRPEFLKVYPIILECLRRKINFITINTGQHTNLVTEMEKIFKFSPDYCLKVQNSNYNNTDLVASLLNNLSIILKKEKFNKVIAQGDTFTVLASSMMSFLEKIDFYHVEAGLRTNNIYKPFPEEYNRRVTSITTTFNFAPTNKAKLNLLSENIPKSKIIVTGNTIIDLLKHIIKTKKIKIKKGNKVLITTHRRENIGENLTNICKAISDLAKENPKIIFYWSLHPNPEVSSQVKKNFVSKSDNLKLIESLNYIENVKLMSECLLLISDSGGIQEEAPSLKKKILILRDETERPEVVDCGCGVLVGSDINKIKKEFYKELNSTNDNKFINPFGRGNSSKKIINKMIKIN